MTFAKSSMRFVGLSGRVRRRDTFRMAVDTLGNLLSLLVTPANEQDRDAVVDLAKQVQEATEQSVKVGFGDNGYSGKAVQEALAAKGISFEVVKVSEAVRGFVLLPETVAGLHFAVFAILMLAKLVAKATIVVIPSGRSRHTSYSA